MGQRGAFLIMRARVSSSRSPWMRPFVSCLGPEWANHWMHVQGAGRQSSLRSLQAKARPSLAQQSLDQWASPWPLRLQTRPPLASQSINVRPYQIESTFSSNDNNNNNNCPPPATIVIYSDRKLSVSFHSTLTAAAAAAAASAPASIHESKR